MTSCRAAPRMRPHWRAGSALGVGASVPKPGHVTLDLSLRIGGATQDVAVEIGV
ncbi:MAG: hypothetical protein N2690_01960 [Rhodocyclaceae bacterium]|nr:hypothetical protein [Rhodocyclaceae bacterium]